MEITSRSGWVRDGGDRAGFRPQLRKEAQTAQGRNFQKLRTHQNWLL